MACLLSLLAIGNTAAQTIVTDVLDGTINGNTSSGKYTEFTGKTVISDAVYAGKSGKYSGTNAIQISEDNSTGIVTTGSGGTVRKITIVWNIGTANGRTLNIYGKTSSYDSYSDLYADTPGTLIGSAIFTTKGTAQTNTIEIVGDYTYIGVRPNSGALYIDELRIEWEVPEGGVAPDMPTITAETESLFEEELKVTISAEDDAVIWYTTDGSDPTVNGEPSAQYDKPLTITSTTTIKAIAVRNGKTSGIASATYTRVVALDGLSALVAKIREDGSSQEATYHVRLTGTVVTGVLSGYAYLEENGTALYLAQDGHKLQVGQEYSGLATVTAKMYAGQPRLTSFDCATFTDGASLPLTTVTLADISADINTDINTYVYRRLYIQDATVTSAFTSREGTISQEGTSMAVYAQGGADITMTQNDAINLIAFPSVSDGAPRLNVLAQEDIIKKIVVTDKVYGYYYLVTSADELEAGARYLIASTAGTEGESINIMSTTQNDNNRGVTTGTTTDNQSVITSPGDAACAFTLGGSSGYWTFNDEAYPGYLYVASTTTSNILKTRAAAGTEGTASISISTTGSATILFNGDKSRNCIGCYNKTVFSCYSPSSDNTQNIRLYKLYTELNIGADGYASFYTDKAFVMPEGVEGGIITAASNGKLTIEYGYNAGETVPAGTALLLKGSAGKYPYECTTTTDKAPTNNLLHGADAVKDGYVHVDGVGVRYYVLSKKNGKDLGFYWAADNGGAFPYQAGKSFLAIDYGMEAKVYSMLNLGDMTTGIHTTEAPKAEGKIYTPTGVYMGTNPNVLPKGIYIIDGKKVAL